MAGWGRAKHKGTPWRRDDNCVTMGIKKNDKGHHWWMSDHGEFYWAQGLPTEREAIAALYAYLQDRSTDAALVMVTRR